MAAIERRRLMLDSGIEDRPDKRKRLKKEPDSKLGNQALLRPLTVPG